MKKIENKIKIDLTRQTKTNISDLSSKIIMSNSELSEAIKNLASVMAKDNELLTFSKQVREFYKNHKSTTSQLQDVGKKISELNKLKAFGEYKLRSLNVSYFKNNANSKFNTFRRRIRKYKVKELIKLYIKEQDSEKKRFIWNFIVKKHKSKTFYFLIKKVDKLISVSFSCDFLNFFKRNKRFYYRKILSFLFKNLDDSHDYSIIQNLQFKVLKPSVLILNNRIHETKYFKTN